MLLIAVVVALNVVASAPAATVTEVGTVRLVLLSISVTLAPPVGAALVRVTVQALEEFDPRLVGVQISDEANTGAARLIVVLAELLL